MKNIQFRLTKNLKESIKSFDYGAIKSSCSNKKIKVFGQLKEYVFYTGEYKTYGIRLNGISCVRIACGLASRIIRQ